MKKKSIIGICLFVLLIAAGIIIFELSQTTQHLTETPPREIRLQVGSNDLTFPVVSGRYLLRIGTSGMELAAFRFVVKGNITTPAGEQLIDEAYEPTDEILSKKDNGGYIARYIDVREKKGTVSAHLEVTFPAKETLICLFQGVK